MESPKRKVLIVEDDLTIEELLGRVVQVVDPEAEIDHVSSAEEALNRLNRLFWNRDSYELVIADIHLDGQFTGIDLWRACERFFPSIPVLLTSGMPLDEFLRGVGQSAVSPPFLPKPFHLGECRTVIENLLRIYRSRPSAS